MTTGVPLYLVSACATAEEFVAAFRRYADRAGLFVPIADPLPQGRRGRIAVTLKTGGVMIEGEVEVVSSSAKPAPIHGRIGMTLKFVEPDEPSRTVLAELEKARLAMRPQPLTVAPRSAAVPAEPRPVVPAPGGRIDATNALAECVLIGDVTVMKEAPKSADTSGPGKFVIPTIPSMGGPARPKSPSTPPALTRPKSTTAVPPPTPALGVKATVMGMPPMERAPATPPTVEKPVVAAKATVMGMPPMERAPAEPPPRRDPTPKPTTLGMPAVRGPAHDTEAIVAQQHPRGDETSPLLMKSTTPSSLTTTVSSKAPPPPARPKTPSTPPMPRSATPFAPLPIVRRPAGDVVSADDGETTDLTSIPEGPPVGEEQRKTSLGVAMMSAVLESASSDDSGRMHIGPPPKPPEPPASPGRSGGLRASEIMAAITPSDDWTMTPDAVAPTVIPPEQKLEVAAVTTPAKPPTPTGDWTISADPSAADGWTEPAKVEVPEAKQQPASGNRNLAVASSTPLEAVEWEEKPTGIGEPLVQIDPTLMEPLKPMPHDIDEPAQIVGVPPTDIPPPLGALFPNATGQNPAIPAPLPFAPPPQFAPPPPQYAVPPPLGQPLGSPPGGSQPFAQQAIPPPLGPMPPRAPSGQVTAIPMGIPTPPPGSIASFSTTGANQAIPPGMSQVEVLDLTSRPRPDLTDGNTGFFRDSGEIPRYPTESTDTIDGRSRKRLLVIIMSAVLAVAAVLIVVIFVFGGSSTKPTGSGSAAPLAHAGSDGSAHPALGSSGSAVGSAVAIVPPDAAVVEPPPPIVDAGAPAPATCAVEVTSVPTGAEIAIDKTTVLGTTPVSVNLPCGVEVKLYIRKAKFGGTIKSLTPGPDTSKVAVRLAAPMFSIKVTSVPAGATITVAGKVVGITPTTVKLPAFTSSTITLSKDGFTPDTQKLAPRANNVAHHVNLKKSMIKQKLR